MKTTQEFSFKGPTEEQLEQMRGKWPESVHLELGSDGHSGEMFLMVHLGTKSAQTAQTRARRMAKIIERGSS